MLDLESFFHLPQVDTLMARIVAGGPGLIVVAGLDPRPLAQASAAAGPLPSGRSAVFRILMRQFLMAHPAARAVVVAESGDAARVPRQLRRRVRTALVRPPDTHAGQIAEAVRRRPELLVIERLCTQTTMAALEAAQQGLRVLSQLDTVFRGADVSRHLLDMGALPEQLAGLTWVLTVQRLPTLCPHCKQPAPPEPEQWAELRRRYPDLAGRYPDLFEGRGGTFCRAVGCPQCQYSGRHGDVAAFDVFAAAEPDRADGPGSLSLEAYVLELASLGYLPLEDILTLESDQLHRIYSLLMAGERALGETQAALGRKVVELEAANRVLQQRTEALISLQGISQALIAAVDLKDLANRVCRYTRDLCGADRTILYFLRRPDTAETLATNGWDPARVPPQLPADRVFDAAADVRTEAVPYNHWPPGIPPRHPDLEGAVLRAGLRVPLVAQEGLVGLMIAHTTEKQRFTPGEVALFQTFAQQAALAIQRAGMVEELRLKDRMERELELARQVQQSVLPQVFPRLPGYAFAGRSEPARQVGGDLYDVIPLDADRFGLVIADVSDKGMPAALYMALTRSLLLAEARRETSPAAVLRSVHRLLLELGEPEMFVTVFYGVVDGPGRRLTYARAGHDPPLLLRGGVVQGLGGRGIFLGFSGLDGVELSEEELDLAPGDRLVLYTDGLTDAVDPTGRLLELAGLTALLQSCADRPAEEMCRAIFEHLATYQGSAEQYDDMTLLVVEVQ